MERLIPHLMLLAVFSTIMIWSLGMQRKSMARQKESVDTQREAVARQKEAVGESLAMSRRQLENQEKIIALLEQIRDRKSS